MYNNALLHSRLKKKNVNVITKQHGSYLEIYNYEQSLTEIQKICSVDNTAKKTEETCKNYESYMGYLNLTVSLFSEQWSSLVKVRIVFSEERDLFSKEQNLRVYSIKL